MIDTPVAPGPKKRGRPRKVVSEETAAVDAKSGVRKASTKTAAARKDVAPKKAAKTKTKTATATATKATAASPSNAAPTSTAPQSKPTTLTASSAPTAANSAPATGSKILDQVYKLGSIKPPTSPPPQQQQQPQEIVLPTGGAANVVLEQPLPPPTPTPTPTPSKPTSSPPKPTTPHHLTRPTPTTIPLPNPSAPASSRPRAPPPLSPEALEKAEIERAISEGRMPRKYKGAARRVTSIMVGIPIIIVVGWELWKRWDAEVRVKYGGGERVGEEAR